MYPAQRIAFLQLPPLAGQGSDGLRPSNLCHSRDITAISTIEWLAEGVTPGGLSNFLQQPLDLQITDRVHG